MEQSKFILEVQSRECLWNTRAPSFVDRVSKRQAWEEIAAKICDGFDDSSEVEKGEKVRELQKKWKSLKDYYKRRNLKEDIDEKTQLKKPIVELLQFLDEDTKFDHHIRAKQRLAEQIKKIKNKNLIFKLPDYKITVQKFNDQALKGRNKKNKNRNPKENFDSDIPQNEALKFLLSLLPVMQSLTDRQRFQFKLEMMMLIKKIKYAEESQSDTEVSRPNEMCFYNRPAGIEIEPPSIKIS